MSFKISDKITLAFCLYLGFSVNTFTQTKVFDKIIASDGSGDYPSIAYAISLYSNSRKVFFIKNGIYKEKVLISSQKTNIRLIGESVDGVIITYDDYAGKSASSSSTAESYTFRVEGNGFYAENITFQNTATLAQAVAVYSKADTIVFKNCRFLGYQDTHYADNGRQYFLNCETRGDVDFIFGNAAAFYENSSIISRNRKGGYVTAPSETVLTSPKPGGGTYYHGILFKNCTLSAESGLANNSCTLGRPWGPYASSVFYRCKIGTHIKPEGWSVWSTDPLNEGYNNHTTAFFAEYNSLDLDGGIKDISQRVSWSKQLGSEDTALYTLDTYFLGWDPTLKAKSLVVPQNLIIRNDSLVWDEIIGARGYVIIRNDSAFGFSVTPHFYIGDNYTDTFKVKSVNPFGALSLSSNSALITGSKALLIKEVKNYPVYFSGLNLITPENISVEIYDIAGSLIRSVSHQSIINLSDTKDGIYIIKIQIDKKGTQIVRKIIKKSL